MKDLSAEILERIRKKKLSLIFLSPHLDDAILSCGGLISSLGEEIKKEIISVFTAVSDKPETEFARKFIKSCGFYNSEKLFEARKNEDKKVAKFLRANAHHLNFIDAAWRKKPPDFFTKVLGKINSDLIHFYPREKDIFSGRVDKREAYLLKKIREKITGLIMKKKVLLFCPLGIGGHVDHILIRDICESYFVNIIYWSDFPYSLYKKEDVDFINRNNLRSFKWSVGMEIKEKLIRKYKTQLSGLFPKGVIPRKEEVFYFNQEIFNNY